MGVKDSEPFGALFVEEYPRLVAELTLVVGDPRLAEELAADAFEQLLRNWKRVSGYERPAAWVRHVALRGAGRARFRRGRRGEVEAAACGVDRTSVGGRDLDLVAALRALSFMQRAAVVLHHMAGYTAAEVGEALGCSDGTVRTHLHRGRTRLAELLEEPELMEVAADA